MPTWFQIALQTFTLFVLFVGLLGLIVPIFPGLTIMWLGTLLYALIQNSAGNMTGWDWVLFGLIRSKHHREHLLYSLNWSCRGTGWLIPGRKQKVEESRCRSRLNQGLYDRLGLGIWCEVSNWNSNDRLLDVMGLGLIQQISALFI